MALLFQINGINPMDDTLSSLYHPGSALILPDTEFGFILLKDEKIYEICYLSN